MMQAIANTNQPKIRHVDVTFAKSLTKRETDASQRHRLQKAAMQQQGKA